MDVNDLIERVRKDGLQLIWASPEQRANRAVVLEAVRQNGQALSCAAPALQADRELLREALRQDSSALSLAPPELRADRQLVIEAVRCNGMCLEWADPRLQADRGVLLEAVRQNGRALRFAAPELRADQEVVMEAVRHTGVALCYAARRLRANREVVCAALRLPFESPQGASKEPQAASWCAAVAATAQPPIPAGPSALSDEVPMAPTPTAEALVAVDPPATPMAPAAVAAKVVVDAAEGARERLIARLPRTWQLFTRAGPAAAPAGPAAPPQHPPGPLEEGQQPPEEAPAIEAPPWGRNRQMGFWEFPDLEDEDDEYDDDDEEFEEGEQEIRMPEAWPPPRKMDLTGRHPRKLRMSERSRQESEECAALQWADPILRADRDLALQVVRRNGRALRWIDEELQGNLELVLEAVQQNGLALQHAAPSLRADREVLKVAVRQNGMALGCAPVEARMDRELAFEAVRQKGAAVWECLPAALKADPLLHPRAVSANPFAVAGSAAPVCSVQELEFTQDGIEYIACLGLGGRQVSGLLPREATAADLGVVLRRAQAGSPYIHLLLPGATGPLKPVHYRQPLVA